MTGFKVFQLFLLVGILAGLAGLTAAEELSADEAALRELKQVLWPKAYAEQDGELLDAILADDFQMVDAAGNWTSKADELAYIEANAPTYDGFEFEIKRLDIFAPGSAIVAGQGVVTGRTESGPYVMHYQSSNVLVKRDGRWQAVASHVSGIERVYPEPSLAQLVAWMSGSFSSAAQAAADSAYYDIRLEMKPIWTDRTDAAWLYVEQAVASMTDRPYRQRVYRVTEEEGVFASAVFTLPDPAGAVGAWRDAEPLGDLSPAELELREGCTVFLTYDGKNLFIGGTDDRACGSGLRGAAYATSEVRVGPGRIESWDRGFDAEGHQVWGAEKGAYVFLRTEEK